MRLRKAVISIKVEPPLQIVKRSIARGVPDSEIELTRYRKIREGVASSFAAKGGVNVKRFWLAMTGSTKRESDVTFEEEAKVMEKVPPILVRPQPGGDQEYRWELEPSFLSTLEGQPWHAIDAPRLAVKSREKVLDPIMKVRVTCKREDLVIDNFELKDDVIDAKLAQFVYRDMNTSAAIQYIRRVLETADLEPGALDNRFSSLILADVTVTPEMLYEL